MFTDSESGHFMIFNFTCQPAGSQPDPSGGKGSFSSGSVLSVPVSSAEAAARERLVQAMLDAPWVPGEGVPAAYSEDSRFAILNDMTAGGWATRPYRA